MARICVAAMYFTETSKECSLVMHELFARKCEKAGIFVSTGAIGDAYGGVLSYGVLTLQYMRGIFVYMELYRNILMDEYSVKISGAGIAVETKVDKRRARQLVSILLSDADSDDLAEPALQPEAISRASPKLSLREFLNDKEAGSKPQQILAIASYAIEVEGLEDISREEVKSRFPQAREPLPSNFPRDFTVAISNGWLAEVHGRSGRFYVTQSGEQALAANFRLPQKRNAGSRRAPSSGGASS